MDKVSQDLNRSKQLREKQAKEFQKQMDTEKHRHQQQVRMQANCSTLFIPRLFFARGYGVGAIPVCLEPCE